ncbi:hypothetical protein HDU98_000572 [Podochytrium sp. JEL0797]|nr:hypothetical protein HDU98_000572 [Podochytrium sp. JEL0797]
MLSSFLSRRKSIKEIKNKLSSASGALLGSRKDRNSVQSVQSRNNGEGGSGTPDPRNSITSTLSPPPPPGPLSASILSVERLDIRAAEDTPEPSVVSHTEEKVVEAVREVEVEVEKVAEVVSFEVVSASGVESAAKVEMDPDQSGSVETAPAAAAETAEQPDSSAIPASTTNAPLAPSSTPAVVAPVEIELDAPQATQTPTTDDNVESSIPSPTQVATSTPPTNEEVEPSIPPPTLTSSNTPTEPTTPSDLPLPTSPHTSTTTTPQQDPPKPTDDQNPYNKNNKYGPHISMNAHQIRMAELLWADTLVTDMLCRGFETKDLGLSMASFHDHCMLIVTTVDVPRLGIEGKRTIYYGWRDIRGWVQDCFDRDVKLRLDSKLTGSIFRSDPGALEFEVAEGIYSGSLKGSLEDYLIKTVTIFLSEFDEN